MSHVNDEPAVRSLEFAQVLERLDDRIYRPGQSTCGVVPLTPAGLERGESMHFMTVAGKPDEAARLELESIRRLMGRCDAEARLNA